MNAIGRMHELRVAVPVDASVAAIFLLICAGFA